MNAGHVHTKENQTERTLYLLKVGTKRKLATQDFELLSTLHEELQKFCLNINASGVWDATDSFVSTTYASTHFLSTILQASQTSHESKYDTEKYEAIITVSIEQGRRTFYMDGEPVKFKILKNKPKNGAFQLQWNANFESLVDFKELFGHTRVTRTTPGYEELGNWVAEQRRKLKKGKITEKQFEMLNSIDFEWDRSHYFFNTYQHKKKLKGSSSPDVLKVRLGF